MKAGSAISFSGGGREALIVANLACSRTRRKNGRMWQRSAKEAIGNKHVSEFLAVGASKEVEAVRFEFAEEKSGKPEDPRWLMKIEIGTPSYQT